MNVYSETEIQIINVYIGCKLRLERLKKNLSQHQVGIGSGTDNTAIGRIERAEHVSSWSNIFLVCQCLNIDFAPLFILKSKKELLLIVNDCRSREKKLTSDKNKYYNNLVDKIENLFLKS